MADDEKMPETLDSLGVRISALSHSVDERFSAVDRQFEDIDVAFADQRQHTEFAFGKLEKQINDVRGDMNGGFGRIDRKLDRVLNLLAGTHARRQRT